MIDDVDHALASFFTAAIPTKVAVRFEPGTGKTATPALLLSLYRLAEEIDGVANDWEDRRDDQRRVIARQRPPRRFCLTYLVDAEAPTTEARHRLLGAAVRAMIDVEVLPPEVLKGALDADLPVSLRPAPVPERSDALLALEVVVALRPTPSTDIAPPAQDLDLTVMRTEPPSEPSSPFAAIPAAASPADRKWRTYRVRETATSTET